jgi:hypothetical protein
MFSSLVTAIGIDYVCKYICTASIMTTSHQQHQVQLPRKEVVYLSLSWITRQYDPLSPLLSSNKYCAGLGYVES